MSAKVTRQHFFKNKGLKFIYILYPILTLLIAISPLFAQEYTAQIDNNGNLKITRNSAYQVEPTANNRINASISLSVTADSRHSATNAIATVTFGADVNLDQISFFHLSIRSSPDFRASSNTLDFTKKAFDPVTRKMQLPIGGLQPNTTYFFELVIFKGCGGDIAAKHEYKTDIVPNNPGKVLLVIDKDFQADPQINEALRIYKQDVTENEKNLIFESYYIGADESEKGKLFEKVNGLYFDTNTPLKYLFFIGKNAIAHAVNEQLDYKTNKVSATYDSYSLGVYAQIAAPEFIFEPTRNLFLNRKYDLCAGNQSITTDITPFIAQSSMFDVSYGALVAPRPEESKSYILKYFEKLHRFKSGKLTFEKKVLLADTQLYDGSLPGKIESLTGRWSGNDTINVSKKFGRNYHGPDLVWQADYLKKLNTNSYEIMTYMGHGSAVLHYFGVGYNEVNNLNNLNTLLLDFTSCSVGDIKTRNFLAGIYLEKGNALIANAYSTNILVSTSGNVSPLADLKFEKTRSLQLFSSGLRISDAYRYGNDVNTVQYLLGDPLLTLDPPCLQKLPLTLTSGGPLDLCPGETTILSAAASFSDYHWFKDGVEINNSSSSFTTTQSGVYTVSAKRCDNQYTSEVPITITEKVKTPVPSLTLDTFPDHFLLSVKPSGVYTDFHWYLNGVKWKDTRDDTIIPQEQADYSVEILQNGCILATKPVTVRIPVPELTISSKNSACEGDTVFVYAPKDYSTYKWFIDGQDPFVSSSNKQSFTKSFRVGVIALRGSLQSPLSPYSSVAFKPKPAKPTITLTENGFLSSALTNNQWYLNGNPVTGSQNALLANAGAGSYFVRVTENNCFTDSDLIVIAANEPVDFLSTNIYPNPSEGTFWMDMPDSFRTGQLEIFDLQGRKVLYRNYTNRQPGPEQLRVTTGSGLYIIRLQTETRTYSHKVLIKQN